MSYATIQEADALLGSTWADELEKQGFLDQATNKIDSVLYFDPSLLVEGQENIFPLVNQDSVPKSIKNACIYEAGQLAKGTPDFSMQNAILSGITSQSTNTASVSFNKNSFSKYKNLTMFYSSVAADLIYSWFPKGASIGEVVKCGTS